MGKFLKFIELPIGIIIILIGLWNISITFPLLLIYFSWIFIRDFSIQKKITSIYCILILTLIFEAINFNFSINKFNSYIYFFKFNCFLLLFYFWTKFFKEEINRKIIFSILSVYLFITAIIFSERFFTFFLELKENFSDISQFRYLFNPFRIPLNEWPTIFLALLPFPFLTLKEFPRNNFFRILLIIVILTCNFVIILTLSRAAILSLCLFYILLCFSVIKYKLLSTKKMMAGLATGTIVMLIMIIPIYSSLLTTIKFNKTESQKRSIDSRVNTWKEGLIIFEKNVFIGVGSNNFAINYEGNRNRSYFSPKPLNSIFQVIIEKGLFGFLLYFTIIILFFKRILVSLSDTSINNKLPYILFGISLITIIVRDLSYSSIFNLDIILCIISIYFGFVFSKSNEK